jgi:cytochrome P450
MSPTADPRAAEAGASFLDPANTMHLDIVSPDVRKNFVRYCSEWATRPPFYVVHDGVVQVMVGRYRDLTEISMDRIRFSVELPKRPGVEKFDTFMGMDVIAQVDGAKHDRLRRLLSQPFTAAGVAKLENEIRRHVSSLLDAIEAKGADEFDLMAEFAEKIMPLVLLETLFQIDRVKWPLFIRMGNAIELTENIEPGGDFPTEYKAAMAAARIAILEIIEQRRANPGTDLISDLIAVRDGTDKLNDEELFAQVFTLLAAALQSTASALGGILLTLGRHPDQFDMVKADPALVSSAVEEGLRVHGSGYMSFPRFAVDDTEVGGTFIPAGVPILMCLGGGNFDPEVYPDPLRFDVHRDPGGVTAFGMPGAHMCLGNRLARMVMRISLSEIITRFPRIRLADPGFEPVYKGHLSEVHCRTLPMAPR